MANDFPNLLAGDGTVGARVVVIGGGKPGISIADLCLRRGRDVTVLEPTNVFCGELGLPERSGAQPPPRPQFQPLSVALSPDAS